MMKRLLSARRSLVGVATVVAVLATAAVAFACTNLAVLQANSTSAQPGQNLTLNGKSFASDGSSVTVRFNSLQGPVLATAKPGADGSFRTTFTVPRVADGQYVLIASQFAEPVAGAHKRQSGDPAFGTPARLALGIGVPGAQASSPLPATGASPAPAVSVVPATESSSTGWVILAVVGALAVVLLAAGLVAFVGAVRRREVGAGVRNTRD